MGARWPADAALEGKMELLLVFSGITPGKYYGFTALYGFPKGFYNGELRSDFYESRGEVWGLATAFGNTA